MLPSCILSAAILILARAFNLYGIWVSRLYFEFRFIVAGVLVLFRQYCNNECNARHYLNKRVLLIATTRQGFESPLWFGSFENFYCLLGIKNAGLYLYIYGILCMENKLAFDHDQSWWLAKIISMWSKKEHACPVNGYSVQVCRRQQHYLFWFYSLQK